MAKTQQKVEDLNGLFIYHDKRRTVYSNPFMKNGYVITNRDLNTYTFYSNKILFALLAAVFAYYFTYSVLIGLIGFAIVYVGITIVFFVKFLPTLTEIEKFEKPEKEGMLRSFARNNSYLKIVGYFIVCEMCGSVFIINNYAYAEETAKAMYYLNAGLALFMMVAGIVILFCVPIKKKIEKEEG